MLYEVITNFSEHGGIMLKKYAEADSLLKDVDAIIALSPLSGLDNVELLVKNSKHVFFEPSRITSYNVCYTKLLRHKLYR